jgi:hypothetical protein
VVVAIFFPPRAAHRAGPAEERPGHFPVMVLMQDVFGCGTTRGVVMSATSGEKRRRKRERQFLDFYDTMSMRATVAGVGGGIALLLWVAARSMFRI